MSLAAIPEILKHCVIAIYQDPKVGGSGVTAFVRAMKIARSRLAEYGYLTEGSVDGDIENIRLTPKGVKRDAYHKKEGRYKSKLFDMLYTKFQLSEEEKQPGYEALEEAKPDKNQKKSTIDRQKAVNNRSKSVRKKR